MYRLKEPTIGLTLEPDGRKTAIRVPARAVVELLAVESTPSMVTVEWDGIICEVFVEVLEGRGEELGSVRKAPPKVVGASV